MSVKLTTDTGLAQDTSNGEWAALCAMATAFGVKGAAWNGCHGDQKYSADTLREMAGRAEQIGRAAEWLRWLADYGGATLS